MKVLKYVMKAAGTGICLVQLTLLMWKHTYFSAHFIQEFTHIANSRIYSSFWAFHNYSIKSICESDADSIICGAKIKCASNLVVERPFFKIQHSEMY